MGGGARRQRMAQATRVEMVTDFEYFLALRPAWSELLARSGSNSLTLSWEWLSSWWRVFQAARSLRIALVWDGNRLIGAAPLLLREQLSWASGIVPTRRMELLASG